MAGSNLASKFAKKVDERFTRESQANMALGNGYEFTGVQTVNIFSIPVVAMTDYTRSGSNRYGTPKDLTRNVQSCTVTRDRAFTFVIDKGDKVQSQMVVDAGKALSRQISEVCIPEFDTYVFSKLKEAAEENGNTDTTAGTASNAYSLFLNAQERLGNKNVPDKGRVCFCSYKFANLLKQDSAFMKYGNMSQEMVIKGVIGEVDGCKIVKVPSGRLPAGAQFILTHPMAAVGPKQIEDYKIHDNPPGVSGWLCEGRLLYDVFVLDNKADAIFYQGGAGEMRVMNVQSAASASGKTTILLVNPNSKPSGHKWYYNTAAAKSGLTAVTAGTAITTSSWTELTATSTEITPNSSHKVARIIEVDGESKPVGMADIKLHIG